MALVGLSGAGKTTLVILIPRFYTATTGRVLNVGLEVTQAWLSSCSDGFIECSSATAAGTLWFYDHNTLGGKYLSHNQSRRACFGLDVVLRNDL